MRQSKADKLIDQRIERAYYKTCEGVQINIMDIGKVFEFGKLCVARGDTDAELGTAIRGYVDTLRRD
jgi:hypothetical protein